MIICLQFQSDIEVMKMNKFALTNFAVWFLNCLIYCG